jgi:DNA-binding transcriptional ArsR family regulator
MSTLSKKLDSKRRATAVGAGWSTAIDLTVQVWPTTDLLMSVLAVVDKPAQRSLEARDAWRLRASALGGDFLSTLDHYGRETWINLLGLPLDIPEARTGPGFVRTVRTMDPEELLRHLSGYFRRVYRRETPAAVMDAAIGGDPAARREFRRTSFPDIGYLRDTLRYLLAREPGAIQEEFAGLVERWQTEVHGPGEADFVAAAERSLASFRRTTDGLPLEQVVERAAPGLTFVPEAGQTSVVLVPSLAVRPLWAVADHRNANVFAFSAPSPDDEPAGPPARLVALGKAIGDETRLRILRELATSPATPPDLADRLGMPRTTLLHHLRILRDADLIAVRVNDANYHQYHVRDEHFGEIERMLEAYLG